MCCQAYYSQFSCTLYIRGCNILFTIVAVTIVVYADVLPILRTLLYRCAHCVKMCFRCYIRESLFGQDVWEYQMIGSWWTGCVARLLWNSNNNVHLCGGMSAAVCGPETACASSMLLIYSNAPTHRMRYHYRVTNSRALGERTHRTLCYHLGFPPHGGHLLLKSARRYKCSICYLFKFIYGKLHYNIARNGSIAKSRYICHLPFVNTRVIKHRVWGGVLAKLCWTRWKYQTYDKYVHPFLIPFYNL